MSDTTETPKQHIEASTKELEAIKRAISDPDKTTEADLLTQETIADQKSDRELKKRYANWFIWILIGQLIVMNAVFIATGLKWLSFDKYVIELYLGGTLAEVFGIVLVITKNLFPQKN